MPVAKKSAPSALPVRPVKARPPLWKGPESDDPNGGITFSMLSSFLSCRERFRIKVIEGLRPADKFHHRMEYGQMWHACEEALAAKKPWEPALAEYVKGLLAKYPMDRDDVTHWFNVCRYQFPLYAKYWAKHPDVKDRTPIFQEKVFRVPYRLPSGRTVWLRGKFDAVDRIGKGKSAGIYLQENKTKADIDETEIKRQIHWDLQTMLYLVALEEHRRINSYHKDVGGLVPTKGIRYNVVRRPLSGGKGSIKRHEGKQLKGGYKPGESWDEFYKRAAQYVIDEPETYFMRWQVDVSPKDVERFRRETLDPILEQLCDWYEWVTTGPGFDPFSRTAPSDPKYGVHWRHPFGCVNNIDEYGWADVDYYLANGDVTGLRRVSSLFTELN